MRLFTFLISLTLIVSTAFGATTWETTKPDGTRVLVTKAFDIIFGSYKVLVGSALLVLGVLLCIGSIYLAAQRKGFNPSAATEMSVKATNKFKLQAYFGFPSLLLAVGAALAVSGALVFVLERIYGAVI